MGKITSDSERSLKPPVLPTKKNTRSKTLNSSKPGRSPRKLLTSKTKPVESLKWSKRNTAECPIKPKNSKEKRLNTKPNLTKTEPNSRNSKNKPASAPKRKINTKNPFEPYRPA